MRGRILCAVGLVGALALGADIFVAEHTSGVGVVVADTGETRVTATSTTAASRVDQAGGGDVLNLYDDAAEVLTAVDGGRVGVGTPSPSAAAIMEWSSTTMGILPPRMTQAQRDAIPTPPAGLVLWNTTSRTLDVYDGTAWQPLGTTGG